MNEYSECEDQLECLIDDLTAETKRLRSALVGLVGTDDPIVLGIMRRSMVRILDASGCAPVMVAAIDVLMEAHKC